MGCPASWRCCSAPRLSCIAPATRVAISVCTRKTSSTTASNESCHRWVGGPSPVTSSSSGATRIRLLPGRRLLPPHRSGQEIARVQFLRDDLRRLPAALVPDHAAAGDHGQLRQRGNLVAHLVRNAVGEVPILRRAEVLEGQHGDAHRSALRRTRRSSRTPVPQAGGHEHHGRCDGPVDQRAPVFAPRRVWRGQRDRAGVALDPLQVGLDLRGALVAQRRVLLQGLGDHALEFGGHIRIQPHGRHRLSVQDRVDDLRGALAAKRQDAGRHLVQDDAEREQIARRPDGLAARLLGRHVRHGAHRRARSRRPLPRASRSRRRARPTPAPAAPAERLARPKSSSFASPCSVTKMFAGLMSRWVMP